MNLKWYFPIIFSIFILFACEFREMLKKINDWKIKFWLIQKIMKQVNLNIKFLI